MLPIDYGVRGRSEYRSITETYKIISLLFGVWYIKLYEKLTYVETILRILDSVSESMIGAWFHVSVYLR